MAEGSSARYLSCLPGHSAGVSLHVFLLNPDEAQVANGALVSGRCHSGVCLQSLGHHAVAVFRLPSLGAAGFHFLAACGEFVVGELHVDAAVRNVDFDDVARVHEADVTLVGGFRRSVADGEAAGTAGETTVGEQGAGLAEVTALEVRGRVEHFLHAGATLRAFVADDDHVASLHHVRVENALHGIFLAFEHHGGAGELEDGFIDAGGLHDAAVHGEVTVQNSEAAVLGVGVFAVADSAVSAVEVVIGVHEILGESDQVVLAARASEVALLGFFARVALEVVHFESFANGLGMDGLGVLVEQAHAVEFTEDAHDTTGAVHILDVDVVNGRGHLADARRVAGEAVDVLHGEVDAGFLSHGEQVEHGVGRTAHGDVEAHGVFEGVLRGDAAREDAFVVQVVILVAEFHDALTGGFEELLAFGVGGDDGAVTREAEAESFGKGVHGVCGEHAGAGTASRAGVGFDGGHVFVAHGTVGGIDHGVNQVEGAVLAVLRGHVASFHRAARDEDCRNVEAHGGHEHTRSHLVAVRDADEGVGAVGVSHVFGRVCNQIAGGQAVEHAVVAHGDTVVHGDGVHFLGDTAGGFDSAGDHLAQVLEVDVARNKLGIAVHHANHRLTKVFHLGSCCVPKGACTGHFTAFHSLERTKFRHNKSFLKFFENVAKNF